ncbi:MAG: hypothetical protein ABI783_01460 [Actinomycetota bacterium]
MDRKRLGWVLAALGAILVVLSALADPVGLGGDDAVGYKQWTGIAVGGVLIIAGLAVMYVKRGGADSDQTDT